MSPSPTAQPARTLIELTRCLEEPIRSGYEVAAADWVPPLFVFAVGRDASYYEAGEDLDESELSFWQQVEIPRFLIEHQSVGCGLVSGAWSAPAHSLGSPDKHPDREERALIYGQWADGLAQTATAAVHRRQGSAPLLGEFEYVGPLQHDGGTVAGPIAEALAFVRDNPGAPPEDFFLLKRFAGVKRNEPCPCGSGMKFKKCCLV